MTDADNGSAIRGRGTDVPRGIGLTGRVAVSWAVAGGILLGGFLVAALTLTEKMNASGLLITSTLLFTVGGLAGFIHGGALGYLGRGPDTSRREAVAALSLAALYTIPMMAAGWVATGWIAMTIVSMFARTVTGYIGMAIGWAAGLGVLAVAVVLGWRALRRAYARWPDASLGTVLVAGSFAALLVNLLAVRPTLWGLGLRVTEVGAIILSALIALWVVGPLVTVALALLRRLPSRTLALGFRGRGGPLVSIAVGLTAGLVMGLIALPFHFAPLGVPIVTSATGALGALVVAVSRALVDEVLLRLILMTGAVWLLLRWYPVHKEGAAVLAILVSAVAQLILYLPGLATIGFPNALSALGYTAAAVIIPAVVFGAVFYARGFSAAVLADATALVALALLA
jgi:hypothetical protein